MAILSPGIHPREMSQVHTETRARMFVATQTLIRAQWVDKICSVHTMGCYSAIKGDEGPTPAAPCTNLGKVMLSERSQIHRDNSVGLHRWQKSREASPQRQKAALGFPGGPVAKTPHSRGLGSIPGQGTRSRVLQLRVCMSQLKIQ